MCLLPLPNTNFTSIAYQKGVRFFDCGSCPECLSKRSNSWALRAVYESREHAFNCMVTLTYDEFVRDSAGRIIGETDVCPTLHVCKRDVQLFIKRLRKWHSSISDSKIKYLVCAEYGSRTHRAHYHVILFGVRFPDMSFYKKSKRGNILYMSSTLTRLWGHGICTIDSVRVHGAVARYCTKYCAKSRSDDTFMLCSQHIGYAGLIRDFNGKSYYIDGREYTVPRFVWEHYIVSRYQRRYLGLRNVPLLDPRYVNRNRSLSDFEYDFEFERSKSRRRFYRAVRDRDALYVSYLSYWKRKGEQLELLRPSARQRIMLLDDRKYHFYKIAALACYDMRRLYSVPFCAPGSNCKSAYYRHEEQRHFHYHLSLALPSRLKRASDTKFVPKLFRYRLKLRFLPGFSGDVPNFVQSAQQLSFDFD